MYAYNEKLLHSNIQISNYIYLFVRNIRQTQKLL